MKHSSSLADDARAIVALNVWQKASACNWVLVAQAWDAPVIVHVEAAAEGPIAGRLMFFPGLAAYRSFALLRQMPEMGFAISPLDVLHYELIGLRDGGWELHAFVPGYVPHVATPAEQDLLAPLIRECRGLLMRFEEDPALAASFAGKNALFSRQEGLDGKWRDMPFALPKESVVQAERITLAAEECAAAAKLPFSEGETWEVDFFAVPGCRTDEPQPRIMYLLAAADGATGARRVWDRMSVAGPGADALKNLWEGLAARLLKAIIRHGRIPGTVSVRSRRMAHWLRPLGLQIPFRLVQHQNLPALDAALKKALEEQKF